jgi:ABC-2 type transport system ATP-binding protein
VSTAEVAQPARAHGVVLLLRNAVGSDTAGVRGAPRGTVIDLSLALGRGIHAIRGAPEDGTLALGDLISGRLAPSRGTLTVDGFAPARDARVRKRIAHLAFAPDLPDARDVSRALDVARAARGGGDPRAMLERLGARQLASRRLSTLTHGEARAVDAAIALSTPSPLVVVVHEPFADISAASQPAIEAVLHELAEGGATVVVITSSPRDAGRLAHDVLVLERGRLIRGAGAGGDDLLDPPIWPHARPRRMELVAHVAGGAGPGAAADESPGRAIARRLSSSAAVVSVSWDEPPNGERGPTTLRIAGPDESACALALLDAADAEGAAIVGLSPVPATLVEVRMATEQLRIAATWHARMQAMTTANAMTLAAPRHEAPPSDAAHGAGDLAEASEVDAPLAIVTPIPVAADPSEVTASVPPTPPPAEPEEPR